MNRSNTFRKIYKNKMFIHAQERKVVSFPYLIDMELTNHCNLKCLFCPGALAMTRQKGFMDSALFETVVDECAKHDTPIRFIRWGEPFLHPNIINFIKYIKKEKKLKLHITNNGLAIKEKHMKALVGLRVDSIIFSMQGATKKEYEAMRDNKRYDELVKNIKKLIKIRGNRPRPHIGITSTMLEDTPEDIKKFRKLWEGIVDEVGIGKTVPFWNPMRLRKLYGAEYTPCSEVYQKLSVDWDGKITACCGDYDNLLTIGEIQDITLKEAWNGKHLKAIRTLLDNNMHRCFTKCSTCTHAYDF